MSKTLTKDQVIALARLARLQLDTDEISSYQKDLNSILEYVEVLDGVDVSGLKPTSQVTDLENVTRSDDVQAQLSSPDELLSVTPEVQERYIKVRRMIK